MPSLYPSLLTGRTFAYLRYRLRFPLLLSTVQFGLHAAEFFLILSSLGGMAAFTVMILRVGSLIVGGAWWGLLEVMRERLRDFSRNADRESSDREIGSWLLLGTVLAVLVTLCSAAAMIALHPPGDDPTAHLYGFLILLELALNFPVRALHSGIYATRRVYRPPWAMFISPTVQLAILGIGFYFYPTVAIFIAIIAANAIGIWITVRYALEAYRLSGLRPKLPANQGLWHRLPRIPVWLGIKTTLSGLGLRLDAVLVLAIVGVYGTSTRSFDLTAAVASWRRADTFQFFYLVLPLFRGTYDSAGIFYFDFVRLRRSPELHELRRQFFHKLMWVAPAVAMYFWMVSAALGLLVLKNIPLTFLLALIPLFVVRSFVGIYQMRLFAEGLFGTNLATMAFLAVLMWLVWIKPDPASDLIQITAAMILQLILLMNLQHLRDRRPPPLPALLSMSDWVGALGRQSRPVILGRAAIPPSTTTKQRIAAIGAIQQTLSGGGHFTIRAPGHVYYFQTADGSAEHQPHLALQSMTGAIACRGSRLSEPAATGHSALDDLVDAQWLAPVDTASPQGRPLERAFAEIFPDGIAFDVASAKSARQMRTLEPEVLVQTVPAALSNIEEGTTTSLAVSRRLTPIYRHGALRTIFVLPDDPDPALLARWRSAVKAWRHG